ncbi:hypothetical protein ABBQ32_005014 [Trebouxia sp. C0010 RCD-2024]
MSSNNPGSLHPGNTAGSPPQFSKGARFLPLVAAGLVGYIGYTVYTGKGKNSPMSTIDQEKETTTNNKDQQPYSGGKKEGNSVNARSERSSIA